MINNEYRTTKCLNYKYVHTRIVYIRRFKMSIYPYKDGFNATEQYRVVKHLVFHIRRTVI